MLNLAVVIAAFGLAMSADQPKKDEVTLTVTVEGEQPAGWPVVVEVKLANAGADPIKWWSGGPGAYPGAEHFTVQVRYGSDSTWHDVTATNGQYSEGSGRVRTLKPGQSVTVPLAIPIRKANHVTVRVSPQKWKAGDPVEASANIVDEPRVLDPHRAKLIAAAIQMSSPFMKHLAEKYADSVVVDALSKLATVDNAPIVAGVTPILARQPELPADSGDGLATAVKRWLSRSPRPEWGGLQDALVTAALKTKTEAARKAVLEILADPPIADSRWIAMDALRLSPGDAMWLRKVRSAIADVGETRPDDAELKKQVKLATDWLDSRLKFGDK